MLSGGGDSARTNHHTADKGLSINQRHTKKLCRLFVFEEVKRFRFPNIIQVSSKDFCAAAAAAAEDEDNENNNNKQIL